jgi:hypothetical protein
MSPAAGTGECFHFALQRQPRASAADLRGRR